MQTRLPFFALALVGLISGLWAGWLRLGLDLPGFEIATLHGPMMVGGFVGTLIGIERSFLSGNGKWWIIPLLSGGSVIGWLFGLLRIAPLLLLGAAAFLVILQGYHLWNSPDRRTGVVQLVGALCFFTGNLRLLLEPLMPAIVPWWMGFVLCFILATRLSDVSLKSILTRTAVRGGLLFFLTGLILPFHSSANILSGAGLMFIAFGMVITEFEKEAGSLTPLRRYDLSGVVIGWFWLLVTGIGMIFWKEHLYGYDATVHAFFLGFLFSMVFVHALGKAAVLGGLHEPPFHRFLYTWLVLLSVSLLFRIFAGDMRLMEAVKQWSGIVNGLSILGFLITLIVLTLRKIFKRKHVSL